MVDRTDRGRRPGDWRLLVTLVVTVAVAVPAARLVLPQVHRQRMLAKLTHADPDQQRRALTYVARRGVDDVRVVRGALQRLSSADDASFMAIIAALQTAGQWRRPPITDADWLRWLHLLSQDDHDEARHTALEQLAHAGELADEQTAIAIIETLSRDAVPDLRLNALITAAQLAARSGRPDKYYSVLRYATTDDHDEIARQAWLFVGLLNLQAGMQVNPVGAPQRVAAAMRWAMSSDRDDSAASDTELKTPPADELAALFASDESTVRDLICTLAARRFSRQDNDQRVAALLRDYNDQAKMSGAILAGLTGAQPELLQRRMRDEDIWAVKQVHRLGMWMQGRLPQMTQHVRALFSRDEMPDTTIVLAMLHTDRIAGLDYLLNPRGQPPIDLITLLGDKHWWHVLRPYLPDDAPRFTIDANEPTQTLQIDVLRNWYLLNRHRLAGAKTQP